MNFSQVLLVHGFKASPMLPPWIPWLLSELAKHGIRVLNPQFPNPLQPQCPEWVEKIFETVPVSDFPKTLFIGHSLGGLAILNALSRSAAAAAGVVFVGTPMDTTGRPIESFLGGFDCAAVSHKAGAWFFFYSKDDPCVPFEHGAYYQKKLTGALSEFTDRGHFEQERFPELLSLILSHYEKLS